jgi:uncharacterized OB-fold protein
MEETPQIPVERCRSCQALGIPPQYVCRICGDTAFDQASLPGRGTVYTHTTIRIAPDALRDQVPYHIVLVDLAPELRVTARLVQDREGVVAVGQEVFFERVDEQGYWFRWQP